MTEQEEFEFRARLEAEKATSSPAPKDLSKSIPEPSSGVPDNKHPALDWKVQPSDILNTLHDAGRGIGLAARGAVQGITSIPGLLANGTMNAYNLVSGDNQQMPTDALDAQMSKVVAPPQNLGERALEMGSGFAAGAAVPLPFGKPAQVAPAPLQQTVNMARDAGYVLPPSAMPNAPAAARLAQALSTKSGMNAAMSNRNTPQTIVNIAKDFGLPEGTQITPDVLKAVKTTASQDGYAPIVNLGAGFKTLLEKIQQARDEARSLYLDVQRNSTGGKSSSETTALAKAASATAANYESMLKNALTRMGKADMYDKFVQARTTIAKASDVGDALSGSTGKIDETILGREFDNNFPQSGAILAAGRTADAVPGAFKSALTELEDHVSHRFDSIKGMLSVTGIPAATRKILMNPSVQDYMAMLTPEERQRALTQALMAAGPAATNASMASQENQ